MYWNRGLHCCLTYFGVWSFLSEESDFIHCIICIFWKGLLRWHKSSGQVTLGRWQNFLKTDLLLCLERNTEVGIVSAFPFQCKGWITGNVGHQFLMLSQYPLMDPLTWLCFYTFVSHGLIDPCIVISFIEIGRTNIQSECSLQTVLPIHEKMRISWTKWLASERENVLWVFKFKRENASFQF